MNKKIIIEKLPISVVKTTVGVFVDETLKRIPIIVQSFLGYRCIITAGNCVAKVVYEVNVPKRFIYGAGAVCSGTAAIIFMGSAATSRIVPNLSFPLMLTGEACFHLGVMLDETGDSLPKSLKHDKDSRSF